MLTPDDLDTMAANCRQIAANLLKQLPESLSLPSQEFVLREHREHTRLAMDLTLAAHTLRAYTPTPTSSAPTTAPSP